MRKLLSFLSATVLFAACNSVPSGIIEPEEMARLLADTHTAESVIELNRGDYLSDSLKQEFKQSVYVKHGVTSEQVDSSLAWYGRNLNRYMEVYDRTIEILEHRLIETGNKVAAEMAMSMAGDSVDVWYGPQYLSINDRMPSHALLFSFNGDENWERGDVYSWRAKVFNAPTDRRWTMVTEYSDGTVEVSSQPFQNDGWNELTLQTDSMLDATRVYGYMEVPNKRGASMMLDSIGLVRKRVNPENYRRYSQRRYGELLKPVVIPDSLLVKAKKDDAEE